MRWDDHTTSAEGYLWRCNDNFELGHRLGMSTQPPDFLTTVLGLRQSDDETRPYVTLTFAQSLDGKIAGKGGKQLILSGRESMVMTHWCAEIIHIEFSTQYL